MNIPAPVSHPSLEVPAEESNSSELKQRGWGWPYGWIGSPLRVALFALVFLTGAGNVALHDHLSDAQRLMFASGVYIQAVAFLFHPRFKDRSIAVVAVVLSVFVLFDTTRTDFTSGISVAYAAYLVSAYSAPRLRKFWLSWLLIGLGVACILIASNSGLNDLLSGATAETGKSTARDLLTMLGSCLVYYAMVGFFWMWGQLDRRRHERDELVRQRAEMAATVERTRIAREMHDIVAHNLAGIMALADGARYAAVKDPAVAVDALETISAQSRASLSQMRGLLSVLREETSRELNAAPGREEVATLFAEARRKGVHVDVVGLEEIPSGMSELEQFTLYRVVQELLTNIMRHSQGRRGSILFEVTDATLLITARNPIRVGSLSSDSGYGLVGVSERLKAHGGRFDAGPAGDTFIAQAKLPINA